MNFFKTLLMMPLILASLGSFAQEGSTGILPISNCTDPEACNYNPDAVDDDGSCAYGPSEIFLNDTFFYFEIAECDFSVVPDVPDFGPIEFDEFGNIYAQGELVIEAAICGESGFYFEPGYFLYLEAVEDGLIYGEEDGLCFVLMPYTLPGCTDPDALNYEPFAEVEDGTCIYENPCGEVVDVEGNGVGFNTFYSDDQWDIFISDQGAVFFDVQSFVIIGSDGPATTNAIVEISIEVPFTGEFSFDWNYVTNDAFPQFDPGYFFDEQTVTDLPDLFGANEQSGSFTFSAEAGDIIGFGVYSTDNLSGNAVLEISNFKYPTEPCIVGCAAPTAENYNPNAEVFDSSTCFWLNACGDIVDSNGNGLGFSDEYAFEFWEFEADGNGFLTLNDPEFAPFIGENVVINASNTGEGTEDWLRSELSIEVPYTGTHAFGWFATGIDFLDGTDRLYYIIDGELTYLFDGDEFGIASTPSNSNRPNQHVDRGFGIGGYEQVFLMEGETFTLGIETLNNCCETPQLVVYEFSYPLDCVGGCQDVAAVNYFPEADYDNDWCIYFNDCFEEVDADGDFVNFTNEFAPENWDVLSMGDGFVTITEDELFISGSDTNESEELNVLTEATIVAPVSGIYTFEWVYFTTDGAEFDEAYFIVNSNEPLTLISDEFGFSYGNLGQSGIVAFEAEAGDLIGFGVNATDDCCGNATLSIFHFTYPPTTLCAPGCTDELACNFDADANYNDGSCDYSCYGCTDETALNYDAEATIEDDSCIYECELPVATATGLTCTENGFLIDVEVTLLGNAAPYLITNDQNSNSTSVASTGTYTVGPFDNEATVILTLTSADAPECTVALDGVECVVNINELAQFSFGLYPNPARDAVTVVTPTDRQVELLLIDATGRTVMATSIVATSAGTQVPLQQLAAGSYLMQLRDADHISNERLIIQR